MFFNVQQPTTQAKLAQLYMGNPNLSPQEVDSNLFLDDSQSHGYIQDQARNLGIGDPVQYFSALQRQQQMASTPNGQQMEAAHQAGLLGDAARLTQRDTMFPTPNLASLQLAAADKQYPLTGNTALSPLDAQEAAARGLDPATYAMQRRIQMTGLKGAIAPFSKLPAGGVDPDALYQEPTFQGQMQSNPGQASRAFSTLTGLDFAGEHGYHQSRIAAQAKEVERGTADLHQALVSGKARVNADGTVSWREMVPSTDPSHPGMVLGSNYGPGDAYQQLIAKKHLPRVAKDLGEFSMLAAKGGQSAPTPFASLQDKGLVRGDETPIMQQTAPIWGSGFMGTMNNAFSGMAADTNRILSGQAQSQFGGGSANDFEPAFGQPVRHVRSLLQNNPQFQALMRRDPAKARALIIAMQQQ